MMSRMQTKLFNALIRECKRGQRLAHFSTYVRYRLEQYERKVRKEIVSWKSNDCAPLFYACGTGNVKMVEYLITICDADVEQTGRWGPHVGRIALPAFETTPLGRACYKAKNYRFGVVRCLVKHGADINRADGLLFDRTCLMESVRNVKMCEFLLKNGADVNARDVNNKTALHCAIEKQMLDAVKLLLDYGADVTLRSNDSDDALQTACLKAFQPIFDYMVEHGSYSPGRLADANELRGSRCFRDTERLEYWRRAIEIRNANAVDGNPLAKTPSIPKCVCYRNASEFTTLDELDAIALDKDALMIQNLLVHERILGGHHGATFEAYQRTGAEYAETLRYQDCVDAWTRALEISVFNDSILWDDVAVVAEGLVRALNHLHYEIPLEVADPNRVSEEQSRFADVVAIFKLLTNRLVTAEPPSKELLDVYSEEGDRYDVILKCVTHLIDLLVKTAKTSEAEDEIRALVRQVVTQNPMSPQTHDTLLHLCVSTGINVVSKYFLCNAHYFFELEVTKLLLECGAHVNARNVYGETPLHIASCPSNFYDETVKLLLDHGAHSDTPDKWGSTPADDISAQVLYTVDLGNYMTLRCLAAQAIVEYEIPCDDLPASVNQFLDLHRPYKPKEQY